MAESTYAEVTLLDYFGVIRRRLWIIIALGVGFGALAGVYAFTTTEQYKVDVLLASADQASQGLASSIAGQLGPLAGLALGPTQVTDKSTEAMATMMSPAFLREFIESRNLLPVLYADEWDQAASAWRDEAPIVDEAVQRMQRDVLLLSQDSDTGFWTLSVIWHEPVRAAEWATALVTTANDHVREKDRQEATRAVEYLTGELEQTNNVAIQQAIFSLIESQLKTEMLTKVRDEYAIRVLGPAIAPDEEFFTYPKRGLLIFFGFVGGIALGLLLAFLIEYRQASLPAKD